LKKKSEKARKMIVSKYIQAVDNPVSLAEMKLHLRVTHSTEDELIKTITSAAADWCESYEGQSYMMKTYRIFLDEFPSNGIDLPNSPVVSITSIQYYDTNNALQTVSSSVYTLDKDSLPAKLYLSTNQVWPIAYSKEKSVIITYVAGYATTFTTAYSTDLLTVGNAVFADTDRVRIGTDQGDLPASLSSLSDYYVRDVSGSTCKLASSSGGTAIDLSDDGTGTHYIGFADRGLVPNRVKAAIKLIAADLYENRQQSIDLNLNVIPFSAKYLLCERLFL
jgi:uncharacterized phiE125 gp8 family phage protein